MAIGDILHNERAEMTDPYTGRPVIRLTTPTRTSHHMYFYTRMVTTPAAGCGTSRSPPAKPTP